MAARKKTEPHFVVKGRNAEAMYSSCQPIVSVISYDRNKIRMLSIVVQRPGSAIKDLCWMSIHINPGFYETTLSIVLTDCYTLDVELSAKLYRLAQHVVEPIYLQNEEVYIQETFSKSWICGRSLLRDDRLAQGAINVTLCER